MLEAKNLPAATDAEIDRQVRRQTRRSFAVGAAAGLAGLAGWTWLRTRSKEDGLPWPLRRALEWNQKLAEAYFQDARLAPTFPRDRADEPRENGLYGLGDGFDPTAWKLGVEHERKPKLDRSFTLDDIKALPRVEMVTEFKCIEGWSQIVQWTGARLLDFAAEHGFATRSGQPFDPAKKPADLFEYVGMQTPDASYFVGLDMASALHPQTLLAYEMNGAPLTLAHGAPLRLVIPVKYGIKNIKRIGAIRFTDRRPADFWAKEGYDWYAGH